MTRFDYKGLGEKLGRYSRRITVKTKAKKSYKVKVFIMSYIHVMNIQL